MLDDDHVQGAAQEGGSEARGKRCVRPVSLEEVILCGEGILDGLAGEDVFLRATDNANVTESQWVHLALNDIDTVSSLVHQINLCQHANGTFTLGVNPARQLQSVRVRQVLIGRGHSHDNCCAFAGVAVAEVEDLAFDVVGLASLGDFRHTWKVNKGQIDD